jgi:hypothetical protein
MVAGSPIALRALPATHAAGGQPNRKNHRDPQHDWTAHTAWNPCRAVTSTDDRK